MGIACQERRLNSFRKVAGAVVVSVERSSTVAAKLRAASVSRKVPEHPRHAEDESEKQKTGGAVSLRGSVTLGRFGSRSVLKEPEATPDTERACRREDRAGHRVRGLCVKQTSVPSVLWTTKRGMEGRRQEKEWCCGR